MQRHPINAFCGAILTLLTVFAPDARALTVADPIGDTFNGGVPIDISGVTTTLSPGLLQFMINFAGNVAAPSTSVANSVFGFVDLDTDQNPSTGGSAPWGGPVSGGNNWINFFIPSSVPGPRVALGDEFCVDLGSELFHPGLVDVVSTLTGSSTGLAPITYGASSFTFTLPLALIANDDGRLNYGVLAGNPIAPTDRLPNGATPPSTVVAGIPEPGTALLIITGLAACWRLTRLRRGIKAV